MLVLMLRYTLSCLFSYTRFGQTITPLTRDLLKRRILHTHYLVPSPYPPIKAFVFTFPGYRGFHKFIKFIQRLEHALTMHIKKGGTLVSPPAHQPLPSIEASSSQGTQLKELCPHSGFCFCLTPNRGQAATSEAAYRLQNNSAPHNSNSMKMFFCCFCLFFFLLSFQIKYFGTDCSGCKVIHLSKGRT